MNKAAVISDILSTGTAQHLRRRGTRPALSSVTKQIARRDLLSFITYTMDDYEVNWHHELICKYLMRWLKDTTGEWSNLMIFAPPRHGKSEIVSRRLPAYILGDDPDAEVINASYGADLAQRMNRDVQRIIDSPKYVNLFPDTRLKKAGQGFSTDKIRTTKHFEIIDQKGSLVSAGVDGTLTGFGGDFIIIDDPVKDMKAALSKTVKKRAREWYDSVAQTRLESGGKVLLTMTRWAQDDLAGELLQIAEDDPDATQWQVLSLPAIRHAQQPTDDVAPAPEDPRDIGEALWKQKKTEAALRKIKASVHSRVWTSLYQQNPRPESGDIWRSDHFVIVPDEQIPSNLYARGVDWDLAYTQKEKNSASAYIAGGVHNQTAYITDAGYFYLEFPELIERMKAIAPDMPKYIENKASGISAAQTLEREGVAVELVDVESDKLSRTYDVVSHGIRGKIVIAKSVATMILHDPKQGVIALSGENPDIDLNDALTQFLRRTLGKYGVTDWDSLGDDPDLVNPDKGF